MTVGYVLCNRYEIVDILGTGGMGKVYLARNINLGTLWAIKELSKSSCGIDISAEVNILKNLDHHSLPKIYDVIETRDSVFIIFTYINGISLNKKLSETGSFDDRTVITWGIALCDVLFYLHNLKPMPIIYRDLKPSNIMLTQDGSIRLIDFGIAREYKQGNNEDTVFIGTKGYAAPEQYGLGQSGPYTDIYSLGVTLRQLLTGESPLTASSFEPLYGKVNKELASIIDRCTEKEVEKRYSNVRDLKEDLSILLGKLDGKTRRIKGNQTNYKIEKKAFFKQKIISLDNPMFSSELAAAACYAGLWANTNTLFNLSEKIIIADEVGIDNINFWNSAICSFNKDFKIDKGKIYFIGWLYDNSKPYVLKDVGNLLNDIKFAGTIPYSSRRYFNTNFSTGAAILNYRNAKKEYNRILYNLKISPVGFTETTLSSILNLVHLGRKKFEQENYN